MTEADKESYISQVLKAVEDFNREQAEYEHKQIIKLCEENDFIVPSEEVREQLEKVLPEARIVVSKLTNDILMIKKAALEIPYELPIEM